MAEFTKITMLYILTMANPKIDCLVKIITLIYDETNNFEIYSNMIYAPHYWICELFSHR